MTADEIRQLRELCEPYNHLQFVQAAGLMLKCLIEIERLQDQLRRAENSYRDVAGYLRHTRETVKEF